MSATILLVEDDDRLADLVSAYLVKHGYQVSRLSRGDEVEDKVLQDKPDLLILDVMLPGKEGFDICRDLRQRYTGRILIMTARDEDVDEILGLELGADDYLAKPVEPRRLLARIRALLRRAGSDDAADADTLVFGCFSICCSSREATWCGESMELTTAEFDLLWMLASQAGTILSRDTIMEELRGIGFDGTDRSIDARISRLRKKLHDNPDAPTRIKTVRGKGYLFSRSDWEQDR